MNMQYKKLKDNFVSTRNPCALCAPLGASVAFRGIENCIPLVHGSQGCSTYIRRYVISHFREPVDIASSNFSEEAAVFGGAVNLKTAFGNIIRQYSPSLIGVASTCLSETIGDDIPRAVREFTGSEGYEGPAIVNVSTPSYRGTHSDGYRAAVYAAVEQLSTETEENGSLNIFPPMVSTEDLRHLQEIARSFGIRAVILPDYSETLDGGTWNSYEKLSKGGTPVSSIRELGDAAASLEIGFNVSENISAASFLSKKYGIKCFKAGLPLGIDSCDEFFNILSRFSGVEIPAQYRGERERLADSYIDGHKYVASKKAVVVGDPDLASAVTSFLAEIGIRTILCATGSRAMGSFGGVTEIPGADCSMSGDADFASVLEYCRENRPDIVIGSSKGYYISRNLGIPLVRAGFPVHDRFGGQRLMHLGYRGTQQMFDRIVNALLEHKQNSTDIGYSYL